MNTQMSISLTLVLTCTNTRDNQRRAKTHLVDLYNCPVGVELTRKSSQMCHRVLHNPRATHMHKHDSACVCVCLYVKINNMRVTSQVHYV